MDWLNELKDRAIQYEEGLISSKEFLSHVIMHVGGFCQRGDIAETRWMAAVLADAIKNIKV